MNKYIFIDLDETLIHSQYAYGNLPGGATRIVFPDGSKYYTTLRPGAKEFLKLVRERYSDVYMLTAACREYAHMMVDTFDLGFDRGNIYAREDTQNSHVEKLNFPVGRSVLVDDLPDNGFNLPLESKKAFLSDIGPLKVINVRPFMGYMNQLLREDVAHEILNKMEKFLNE
jgi:hypothetical protein